MALQTFIETSVFIEKSGMTVPGIEGRIKFSEVDNQLYRYSANKWVSVSSVIKSVTTEDAVSSITNPQVGQLAYAQDKGTIWVYTGNIDKPWILAGGGGSASVIVKASKSELDALIASGELKHGAIGIDSSTNKQYWFKATNGEEGAGEWVLVETAEKITITPSVSIGALDADVTLENMSAEEILKKMLEKELFATVAANKPSASLSRSGNSEAELGASVDVTLTASGDRGTYSPYWYEDEDGTIVKSSTSGTYAGAIESYTFSGSGISTATTQTANTYTISGYTVGTSNSWTVKVLFADGEEIMSSQGNYGTPAKYTDSSDTGKTASASITPTFPIFLTSADPSVLARRSTNVKTSNSYIEVTLPIETSPDGTNINKLAFLVPSSWLDGAYKVEVYNEGNGKWEDKTSNWTEYSSTIDWSAKTVSFTGAAATTIANKTISGTAPLAGDYKLVVNSGGLVTVSPKVRFYR